MTMDIQLCVKCYNSDCHGDDIINIPPAGYDDVILGIVNEVQDKRHPYKRLTDVIEASLSQIDNARQDVIIERIIALAREERIILRQKFYIGLNGEDIQSRVDNPIRVGDVYIFPLKSVLVKAPSSIKG